MNIKEHNHSYSDNGDGDATGDYENYLDDDAKDQITGETASSKSLPQSIGSLCFVDGLGIFLVNEKF